MLTEEQVAEFKEQGFLAIPDFSTPQEVEALLGCGTSLIRDMDVNTVSIFSTRNQTSKTDEYFLDSANNVSFFFEEGAFDVHGNLVKEKELAINKIGHAMHDIVPEFRRWTRENPKVKEILRDLGYRRPLPVQSMYICKQPGIGGEVVPHQDSSFLATEPPSVIGLWLALEDATVENGCLWGLPGSHSSQRVYRRFIRSGNKVQFEGNMPTFEASEFKPIKLKLARWFSYMVPMFITAKKTNLKSLDMHSAFTLLRERQATAGKITTGSSGNLTSLLFPSMMRRRKRSKNLNITFSTNCFHTT